MFSKWSNKKIRQTECVCWEAGSDPPATHITPHNPLPVTTLPNIMLWYSRVFLVVVVVARGD